MIDERFGSPMDNEENDDLLEGFDDVKNPFLVTKGEYLAQVTDAERGESKSGNPKVVLTWTLLKCLSTPNGVEPDPDDIGKDILQHCAVTQAAKFRFRKQLIAMGVEIKPGGGVSIASMVGKKAKLVIDHRDWDGDPTTDIKKILPYSEEGSSQF